MDVGRNHEIPRSEMKDFIIYGPASSMRINILMSIPLAPSATEVMWMNPGIYK